MATLAWALRLMVLMSTPVLEAAPPWGANCLNCHNVPLQTSLTVFGEDGFVDPDESATGAPDRGLRKVFQVAPGQTRTLRVEIADLEPGDSYAVELHRLQFSGVESGGTLLFSEDCDWAGWGPPGRHFTDPALGHAWDTGPTDFHFDLEVTTDADQDFYNLVFAVAGLRADGSLFHQSEHFYLEVVGPEIFTDDFETGNTSAWTDVFGGVR
jgi:hypothetical protein